MKIRNIAVYASVLGLSLAANAATVNTSDTMSVPISVSFAESAASFTANWKPVIGLSAGELTANTELGRVEMSNFQIYGYKMSNNDNANYPHYGLMVKEGDAEVNIPIALYPASSQGIYPGDKDGVAGWTISKQNTNILRMVVRSNKVVTAGNYNASITLASAVL